MKLPIIGQIVGYVTPATKTEPSKIVEAKVTDVYPADGMVHLDYSDGNPEDSKNYKERRAIAAFNDDKKTENTWHELELRSSSPAAPAKAAKGAA